MSTESTDFTVTTFASKGSLIPANLRSQVLAKIENIEKRNFPKNEVMSITTEARKNTNTLYVAIRFTDFIYGAWELASNSNNGQEKSFTAKSKRNKKFDKSETQPASNDRLSSDFVILGYAIFSLTTQPPVPLRLLKLCVDPKHRRCGVGRALLHEGLTSAAGACRLHVDVDREAALALYASFGFVKVELIKDYYEKGRDAFLLERNVTS